MSIAAPKVDEESFYELFTLLDSKPWLRQYQSALIELWNICDEKQQRSLLEELLNRFLIIDSYAMADVCRKIKQKTVDWAVNVGRTFFVAVADGSEVDGSHAGLEILKSKFPAMEGWKESYFIPTITKASTEIQSNSDVIVFDDFIGTGKKMSRRLEWFKERMKERGIKLSSLRACSFAGMEFGLQNIVDAVEIEVYTPQPLKKGISDYNTPELTKQKKDLMLQLEKKLHPKVKKLKLTDHTLGYKGSESLFSIHESNCPNNVFPIFWWPQLQDGSLRKTILARAR